MDNDKPFVIGITGASGTVYGIRLIEELLLKGQKVLVSVTEAGKIVLNQEVDIDLSRNEGKRFKSYLVKNENLSEELVENKLKLLPVDRIDACIAGGSCRTEGMAIVPCSMSTLSGIKNGRSSNLIERAADVILKEGLPLLLSPREMPLNSIHLENMLKLSKLGVIIAPPMPGFYHDPQSVEDVVDFVVGKLLDRLGLDQNLFNRWEGREDGEYR